MDYHYVDYTITQNGYNLECPTSIKIQKMENKVTRLIFELEDWLIETTRLYVAFLNPETFKYHYEPILFDGEIHYVIIGTSVSYYPKKHKMLLIGVSPSFTLDDNVVLDKSNIVYVSKEFNGLVVINNFISDVAKEVSYPNIDYALDNFIILHDNVIDLSIQTADDATKCDEDLKRCEEILETCTGLQEDCNHALDVCTTAVESCTELEAQCKEDNEESRTILSQNRATLNQCNDILTQCQRLLSQCQQTLTQVSQVRTSLQTNYNNYQNSMRQAYEQYMNSIRNGGEP